MGLYWSLYVLMRPDGSLRVLIVPFASVWILMGPYGFL